LANDFPSVEKFLLALNDLAEMGAGGAIGTGAFQGAGTILDLGGGGGGYSAALAQALPDARVTLADLPEILPIAEGYFAGKGLSGRVELVAADFLIEDCGLGGRTFDCAFLSHILHDFDATAAAGIVARAARLVRSGGKLIILDVLTPEAGHSNPVEALFDLMMLVEVPGGRTHGISEVSGWIQSAGLAEPRSHKLFFGMLLESLAGK
jgi:ubiquinone/menaquinone biosynthesis C-methylase UbiE